MNDLDASMRPSLTVRTMNEHDLRRVTELASVLGYTTTSATMAARFAAITRRTEQGLFVAERDGVVIGWLHAATNQPLESEPYAEIVGLVVDPEARRAGVGRALVESAVSWARSLGYARLAVRSNVARVESHIFYPALGFELRKTQHTYQLDLE